MTTASSTTPSVLVVGSINLDVVVRTSRLPCAGESLIGTDYCRVAGGKGANQAVAVARLGATATFVGKIGADQDGAALLAELRGEGVRTQFVSCCSSAQTGLAVVTIDGSGLNSIVAIPGANNHVTEQDVCVALRTASFDAVMVQFEIPVETVIATCHLANEREIPVVLDAGPAQPFPLERLQGVHILSPNETETEILTGINPRTWQEARAAAEVLLQRSRANSVVLKLGDRGSLLCGIDGVCESFPAYSVDSVDTTAAGDAFTAAMTVEYVRNRDLHRAVTLGNAAGALATTHIGAQPSLPTALSLSRFCAKKNIRAD